MGASFEPEALDPGTAGVRWPDGRLSPSTAATPPALARGVTGAFQICLGLSLGLIPSVFVDLQRFGTFGLLLVVCLLVAFWVLCSLLGLPLWHVRSWVNVLLWGLWGLMLVQTVPLPLVGSIGMDSSSLGPAAGILVDGVGGSWSAAGARLEVGRYSLRPTATLGVLVLATSAVGLYWLIGATVIVRKRARRATWAVLLGLAALAFWVVISAFAPEGRAAEGMRRGGGPLLVLGGDNLVPALLAALPLGVSVVLRLVGWTPRKHYLRRQSRWGWVGRAGTVWGGIGLALTSLLAVALGMSNVPRRFLMVCVALAVGFVLAGYVVSGPRHRDRRRPGRVAIALGLWVVLMVGLGMALGPEPQAAAGEEERLMALVAAMPADRAMAGAGAGTVSPRVLFGEPGWPTAAAEDHDTNGYLVLRAEVGWGGLVLVWVTAIVLVVFLLRAWRRTSGPWPKTLMQAGIGVVASNLLYFQEDAVLLLAPNLVALAAVLGVVMAWSAHGAAWRPSRRGELGESHWPLVFGAVGLVAVLGIAENEMLVPEGAPRISDKIVHLGIFAVVSLLLCYALGPQLTSRHLKTRIFLAILGTTAMGVVVELAQRYLTVGRSFEWLDIAANVAGAATMGLLWWMVRRGQILQASEAARTLSSA